MKVLGVNASPRKNGNSDKLLNRALEGAFTRSAEVEKIFLNDLNIKPCQGCGGCDKTGICVITDDMSLVYDLVDGCDAIIIASPIYFTTVTAQFKAMVDRFQCKWVEKYALKTKPARRLRRGLFLSSAGSYRKDFFINASAVVKAFFATLDVIYAGELLCGGMDNGADMDNNIKYLTKASRMGQDLAS